MKISLSILLPLIATLLIRCSRIQQPVLIAGSIDTVYNGAPKNVGWWVDAHANIRGKEVKVSTQIYCDLAGVNNQVMNERLRRKSVLIMYEYSNPEVCVIVKDSSTLFSNGLTVTDSMKPLLDRLKCGNLF